MSEEEKWQKKYEEWWENAWKPSSREGYFQGRKDEQRVRRGEIERLKVKINHLAEDLKQAIEIAEENSGYPK